MEEKPCLHFLSNKFTLRQRQRHELRLENLSRSKRKLQILQAGLRSWSFEDAQTRCPESQGARDLGGLDASGLKG